MLQSDMEIADTNYDEQNWVLDLFTTAFSQARQASS